MIEYYMYPENEYYMINNQAERKPTWEQLQYLIRMIEYNVDAVPTIDEVYKIFKIALEADQVLSNIPDRRID